MVCQGLAVQNRTVLDPRVYLKEMVGMDAAVIDEISQQQASSDTMADMMDRFADLEVVLKEAATKDDEKTTKNA